jgi:dTDP-glucose 4,6-dehydratase
MTKTTALVTGGAGFLGSHLCDLLIGKGHKVICVDNLVTGNPNNISAHRDNPDFKFIQQDISGKLEISGKLDYVFHFASPASPIDYLKLPIETLKVGSLGTFNILELARKNNARFLISSTSEVYGDPLQNPQKETYWGNVNPIGPRSVYDESKRFSEACTMAYFRQYGVDTKIIRIFNTYGPRMRRNDGRIVPSLIIQALKNQPMTIFGDGKQTRSFCYVSDLIRGIYAMMQSDGHGPVNLGNPLEITILELADRIKAIAGCRSEITAEPVDSDDDLVAYCQNKTEFLPLPQDDPRLRQPDISKAREVLGWGPEVELDAGLGKTIAWFKENYI